MVTTVFLPDYKSLPSEQRPCQCESVKTTDRAELIRPSLETELGNLLPKHSFRASVHQRHLFTFGDIGKRPEESSYVLRSLKCVGAAHTSPLARIFITELTQPLTELLKLTASCLLRLLCSKCGENTDSAHQASTRALVTQPRPQLYPPSAPDFLHSLGQPHM